jgi:hypothetical protein
MADTSRHHNPWAADLDDRACPLVDADLGGERSPRAALIATRGLERPSALPVRHARRRGLRAPAPARTQLHVDGARARAGILLRSA